MKRTLHLTSPLMRGDDVSYAQNLLTKNKFNTAFLTATHHTGKFDEVTAAAVRRAKWELGYPQDKTHAYFDTQLEKYLRKEDPSDNLPLLYRRRRKQRLTVIPIGQKALTEAIKWLGTKEYPAGTNHVKPFGPWYNNYVGPWCAVFVSYCLAKVGFKEVSPDNERWAYVPYIVNDARNKRHGLRVVSWADVKPGDLVCYDWPGESRGTADHVGFFEHKTGSSTFRAVEGNTAVGNDSNGGEVMRRDRNLSDVQVFVRVG